MKTIKGSDVILEVYKGSDYHPLACMENVSISFSTETVSVKTVGDGPNARVRARKKSFSVSCDGIIAYDTENPNAFDLLDYYKNMVDVPFRLVFYDQEDGVLKAVLGNAVITELNMTGPSDFAGISATLSGSGIPSIQDNLLSCQAEIGSVSVGMTTLLGVSFNYSGVSGAARLEYSVGIRSGRYTKFNPGASGSFYLTKGLWPAGSYTLYVWPLCESGEEGEYITCPFTFT